MNSPHRTRRSSNVLLVLATMLLFVGMEAPLLGMDPPPQDPFSRTSDLKGKGVADTTGQNRRSTPGAEDNGSSELGSPDRFPLDSDTHRPNRRNPRRQSSRRKFSIEHPPLQQQLATELTSYRKQIEEETAAKRAQLAQSLFEKQSPLQAEQNAPEDFSDREKVYASIEALHARQQEALEGIRAEEQQLIDELRSSEGCFSLFYSSEKKFIARENAIHQKLVTLSQGKISSYSLELDWLLSFSPKRNTLLVQSDLSSSSTENHQQQTTVETALKEAQGVGQHFINSFCKLADQNEIDLTKLDSLSDEQLHFINEVIDLVRNTQLFILGYDSSSYITMSKEQLAEVENDLEEKIKALDPSPADQIELDPIKIDPIKIDPIIKERYLAAQELLENSKAQFLLMETTPEGKTIHAAAKSAKTIDEQAQETEKAKGSLEAERNETAPANQSRLAAEIDRMKELHDSLLNAMLSYGAIQDEAWIENQCGNLNELHDRLISAISAISANNLRLSVHENAHHLSRLTTILEKEEFHIDPPLVQPASPLEFLETLMSLSNKLHAERIIGTHGKIALEHIDQSSPPQNYSNQTRREWMAGTNLIRLAICITRGIEVLRKFDAHFRKKIHESNSFKVHEVFDFLLDSDRQLKYPRSFFVNPNMSHEDFLKILSTSSSDNTTPSDKVIKIDQATLDFNPFSKKQLHLPQENFSDADLRQREAGFQYVRKALEKAFPEAFLTTEQMHEVLQKFDEQFKVTPEGTPLTLEKAHAFIESEREVLQARGCWAKYVARYLDQEAITHMLNGLYYSIGTHILPVALLILSYLYYSSLTHTLT